MKRTYFMMLLACLSVACSSPTQVGIQIQGGEGMTFRLVTPDSSYAVAPDSSGAALIVLPGQSRPGYGALEYGRQKLPLYFGGKSFGMVLKMEKESLQADFSGKGAAINTYLNDTPLCGWRANYKLTEGPFVAMLDSMENAFLEKLGTLDFDQSFVEKEKQRIHYLVQGQYANYPGLYHSYTYRVCDPSEAYYKGIEELLIEDEALLELAEYKTALYNASTILALKKYYLVNHTRLQKLEAQLSMIEQSFKSPAIISYLTDKIISTHVKRNGMGDEAYFTPIYNANVTDTKAKADFNALREKWAVVAPGQPSPEFCYPDVDDQPLCLKDLAGKYVYIDLWATWCGPCRAEFPALYKLEHLYKDKDIHFVSISSDTDRDAWKQLVREDKMPGIQLNVNGSREFMDAYLVNSIPRFILLDKEGRIINSDMTRPSNPETVVTLNELLK